MTKQFKAKKIKEKRKDIQIQDSVIKNRHQRRQDPNI